MQIGTATSSISLTQALTQRASVVVQSLGGGNGPSTLSVGPEGIPVTGFPDYSRSLTQGLWQYDLSTVIETGRNGLAELTISDEQRKAEEKAVASAFDLMNAGQIEEARDLMTSLLKKNNTNAAAVHALGYVELTAGNYAEAEQQFLRAHAMNSTIGYDLDADNARILSNDSAAALARARQLVRSADRRDDGIRVLIELSKRSEDSAEANIALGEALLLKGDTNDALLQFSGAIGRATATELNQLDDQLATLAERIPDSAFVQQLRGRIAIKEERFGDALSSFSKAASISPTPTLYDADLARAHIGLGRELLGRGRTGEALLRFEEARRLSSTSTDAKVAMAEGQLARAADLTRFGALNDAANEYDQVASLLLGRYGEQELRARAASGAYALGRRLADARVAGGLDIGSELVAFQAAHDLDPKNTTYAHRLADTRIALGDKYTADGKLRDAAYSYERAYELDKRDAGYKQKMIAGFTVWGDQVATALVYDDAVTAYRKAYEADIWNDTSKGKLAGALSTRGLDYASKGKYKEAAHDFSDALALRPGDAAIRANYDLYKAWL